MNLYETGLAYTEIFKLHIERQISWKNCFFSNFSNLSNSKNINQTARLYVLTTNA